MRTRLVLVGVALVAAVLVAVPAAPQSGSDEAPPAWWPDDPAIGPDDLRDAWHLRTRLKLDPVGHDRPEGTPVQIHLDLGAEALRAGWPAAVDGESPKAFTLDPDSVRVVRYDPSWEVDQVVPATASVDWYDEDQTTRYDRIQTDAFHPQSNPVMTVEWRLVDEVKRFREGRYHVQFDILENRDKSAPSWSVESQERLDSLYWVGPGEILHGYHLPAKDASPTLTVIGTEDGTEVEVETYRGSAIPSSPNGTQYGNPGNPFTIDAGEMETWSFGATRTLYRIEATEAILAVSHDTRGSPTGSGDVVPSTDGGPLGRHFYVPPRADLVYLIAPDWTGEDDPEVTFTINGLQEQTGCNGRIDPDNTPPGYYCLFQTQSGTLGEVAVGEGGPLLMQYVPPTGGDQVSRHARAQAASIFGSPTGHRFLQATAATQPGGVSLEAPVEEARVTITDPDNVRNFGSHDVEPGERVTVPGGQMQASSFAGQQGRQETPPLRFETDPATPVAVRVDERFGSPETPQTTPFGGRHGMEFSARTPFAVQPFYDPTEVTVDLPGETLSETLSNGRAMRVDDPSGVDATVTASQPVSVFPLGDDLVRYSRFLAGRPSFEEPTIVDAEYRGYLVDVRPESGQSPVLFEGLPGDEVRVPFRVENLGRWDGKSLPDEIQLTATTSPDPWGGSVTFEEETIALDTAEPERTFADVRLPKDMEAGERVTVTIRATSSGNDRMTSSFDAVVLSRRAFGVGMWFGPPDSSPSTGRSQQETLFQPGEEVALPVVVQNTGTAEDSYNLSISGVTGGWGARMIEDGTPVDQIGPIEPDRKVPLDLRVRAPETETVGDRFLTVQADSVSSSQAASIQLHARLSLGRSTQMTVPEATKTAAPGETATFPVEVLNTGKEGISLDFHLVEDLPEDWSATILGPGDIAEQGQSLRPDQSVEVIVGVRVGPNASADRLRSVLLQAEGDGDVGGSAPLTVEVDRQHDLVVGTPEDPAVRPGETADLHVNLTNEGNGEERVVLVPISHPGRWNVSLPGPSVLAPDGGGTEATVAVTPPLDAAAGPVPLAFEARGTDGDRVAFDVTVDVRPVDDLIWQPSPKASIRAGDQMERTLSLVNRGNVPKAVSFATDGPPGWQPSVTPSTLEIPPGVRRAVTVEVEIPHSAEGTHNVTVTAAPERGQATRTTVRVQALPPRVELSELMVPDPPTRPGDVVFLSAILHNPEPVDAPTVEVRLLQGDATLDTARFESIGPNGTVVAPLKWTHQPSEEPVRVAWGEVRDAEFESMGSQPVQVTPAAGDEPDEFLPGPSAAPVVAAILVATLLWSRSGSGGGDRR